MKILLVHQNFPGQFKFLGPALAARGHEVTATTMQKVQAQHWQGVRLVPYAAARGTAPGVHPWVADIETKENDRALVRTILAMADTLGLAAVAEHVETPQQEALLRTLGCRMFQGYLYAPSLPADEFLLRAKAMPSLGPTAEVLRRSA